MPKAGLSAKIVMEALIHLRIQERTMAEKKKTKRVILEPEFPPQSFTRAELLKVIKEVKAARLRRKHKSVSDGAK
jgi:hypothetical protein